MNKSPDRHKNGPGFVIAGAGTGKTTTLVNRIGYLIKLMRIDPEHILVTTFTRKATAELYLRCAKELGPQALKLNIKTIDSLVLDIAKKAVQRGVFRPFKIFTDVNKRLLLLHLSWEFYGKTRIFRKADWGELLGSSGMFQLFELCIQTKFETGEELIRLNKKIKNRYKEIMSIQYLPVWLLPHLDQIHTIADEYIQYTSQNYLNDYNEITTSLFECLCKQKNFLKDLTSKIKFILVDEFQDTSTMQMEFLLLLSGKKKNLWVVGDPCQQIYEWRGASDDNFKRLQQTIKPREYKLKDNYRSTQTVLDCAYKFLALHVPKLRRAKHLTHLNSVRSRKEKNEGNNIFSGNLDQVFAFIKHLLITFPELKASDIAILSRELGLQTISSIETKARQYSLNIQYYSTRVEKFFKDHMEGVPNWSSGISLKKFYSDRRVRSIIRKSLKARNFKDFRLLSPSAYAADALDSTVPAKSFTFSESWSALRKSQTREIEVSSAVVQADDAIQVMTIHAAKGLEFPITIVMKFGEGSSRSFPKPKRHEDARLAYVGITRARDLCIIVHTINKPHKLLKSFGSPVPLRKKDFIKYSLDIKTRSNNSDIPIIAATQLEMYDECQLKFAAYHEGKYLPMWSEKQSVGSRLHKAIELFLLGGMLQDPAFKNECFEKGIILGDSKERLLPDSILRDTKAIFDNLTEYIPRKFTEIVLVEESYRYLHGDTGQIEGVVDAVFRDKNGKNILVEWKTWEASRLPRKSALLQVRAATLGLKSQKELEISKIQIVPIGSKNLEKHTKEYVVKGGFIRESKKLLDQVFYELNHRTYKDKRGKHCENCQLKRNCPAWKNK